MNCYTEIATVSAVELAQTIAPYAHLIPSGNVQFNTAEDGNLVVELFNGVICWESAKAGTIAVKAEYLSTTIGEPALPSFVPTTVTAAPAKEKKTRNRRSNAQIAADEAAEAERLAAIAKTEAVLDADVEGEVIEAAEGWDTVEVDEDDAEPEITSEITSEISTVSKRNLFANAA
jgi:hypothetical protein